MNKVLFALGLVMLVAVGCGGDDDKKTITSVAVDNGGQQVIVGGTTKVTLTATLADGSTQDLSLRAAWTTELPDDGGPATEFATVDGDGTVRGVEVGTYFVIAVLDITDGDGEFNAYNEQFTIGFDTVRPIPPADGGMGDAGSDAAADSGTAADSGAAADAAADATADAAADATADAT